MASDAQYVTLPADTNQARGLAQAEVIRAQGFAEAGLPDPTRYA